MPQKSMPASGKRKEKDIPKKKSTPASGTESKFKQKPASGRTLDLLQKPATGCKPKSKVETKVTNENKKMEVETKVTNEKKKKREEVNVTTGKNSSEKPKMASGSESKFKQKVASGSESKATQTLATGSEPKSKRNSKPARTKSPSSSSSGSYSYYTVSDSDGNDENKLATGGEAAPKPEKEMPPTDWGVPASEAEFEESDDESEPAPPRPTEERLTTGSKKEGDFLSPTSEDSDDELEPAPPRPTEERLTTGSKKGDLPATGGIKTEDFNEDDKKEEWQWTEKPPWKKEPPWKKVKLVEDGGQKSSWKQSEYYKPASGGTWPSDTRRNHWQSQGSWWGSSSDDWERQWQPSAWTSGDIRRRVPVHPDARCSVVAPVQPAVISEQLADALANWAAFPSSSLFLKGGLDEFARRVAGEAKEFQDAPPEQWLLQTDLPLDPSKKIVHLRPASGGASDRMSIKDAVARHRGEVRELPGGYWDSCEEEPATTNHPQLEGLISRQASGSLQIQVRVARVCSLMDIFSKFGDKFSAKELYDAYLSFPLIVRRRTPLKNRAAAHAA